jgi:hypothetical protein
LSLRSAAKLKTPKQKDAGIKETILDTRESLIKHERPENHKNKLRTIMNPAAGNQMEKDKNISAKPDN